MPYKSEKIKIENTRHDRRVKLSPKQKDEILNLRGLVSQRECAQMYGVSRRTIVFIWFPERKIENLQRRQERGGWKQYYDTAKNREAIKNTRRYKQELYLKGEI